VLVVDDGPRAVIDDLVTRVVPFDRREVEGQADIRGLMGSGASQLQVQAPVVPARIQQRITGVSRLDLCEFRAVR
jgi:hypothetical protein